MRGSPPLELRGELEEPVVALFRQLGVPIDATALFSRPGVERRPGHLTGTVLPGSVLTDTVPAETVLTADAPAAASAAG
ncbi:hypothetical protein [Streptomyces sp. NPDC088725]|uniref:hypothetical protein n=1 Tax=Streptomyces sp. NPDC088725 TaxID=3365873 RepID=UPI00380E3B3C